MHPENVAAFWGMVPQPDIGCWEWPSGIRHPRGGYGRFCIKQIAVAAHRYAYAAHHGLPLQELNGLCVCHHCDNPPCVRPDHLFLGTVGDNARDAAAKGHFSTEQCRNARRGEKSPKHKLTEPQVLEIRSLSSLGLTNKAIAANYGVSNSTIRLIVCRITWPHV